MFEGSSSNQPPLPVLCPLGKNLAAVLQCCKSPGVIRADERQRSHSTGRAVVGQVHTCVAGVLLLCGEEPRTAKESSPRAGKLHPILPPLVPLDWNGSFTAQAPGFTSLRLMSLGPEVGGSLLWLLITSGHLAAPYSPKACITLLSEPQY